MTALLEVDAETDGGGDRDGKSSQADEAGGGDEHDNHDSDVKENDGRFGDATTSSSSSSSYSSSSSSEDGQIERHKQQEPEGHEEESAPAPQDRCKREDDDSAEAQSSAPSNPAPQNTTPTTRRRLFPTLNHGVRVGTGTTAALRRRAQQRNSISHPPSASSLSSATVAPRQPPSFARVVPLNKETPHPAHYSARMPDANCDKASCGQLQQQQLLRIAAMEQRMRTLECTVVQLCKRLEDCHSVGPSNNFACAADQNSWWEGSDSSCRLQAATEPPCRRHSLVASEGDQDEDDIEEQDTAALEKAVNVVLRSRPSYIHRSPSVRWSIRSNNDAEDEEPGVAPTGVSIPIPLDSPFPTPRQQRASKGRNILLPATDQQHLFESQQRAIHAPPLPQLPNTTANPSADRMPVWSLSASPPMLPGPPLLPLSQPQSALSTSPDSPLPQPAPLLGYRTYTLDYEAELLRHRTGEEFRRRALSLDETAPVTLPLANDALSSVPPPMSAGHHPRRLSTAQPGNEGVVESEQGTPTEDVGLYLDGSGPGEEVAGLLQREKVVATADGSPQDSRVMESESVMRHGSPFTIRQEPSDGVRLSGLFSNDRGMMEHALSTHREEHSPPSALRRVRGTSNASSTGSAGTATAKGITSTPPHLARLTPKRSSQHDENDANQKHLDGRPTSLSRPRDGSITSQHSGTKDTMLSYVKADLLNVDGRQQDGSGTEDVDANMEEFLNVPSKLESVLLFGSFICVDAFLNVITMLPLRFVWSCFCLVFHVVMSPLRRRSETGGGRSGGLRFHRRHLYQLLNSFVIYFVYQHVLCRISIGKLYHWIRGQAMIKLYVLVAIVEVFDRLMCSLGQDALDSLYWNTTRRPQHPRMIVSTVVVFAYVVLHSVVLLVHVATLNVAMNSADQALLTLLISGNFAEIKSFVFKKYSKQNLFKIAVSDICERFKIVLFLGMIFCLNCFQGIDRAMVKEYFQTCGVVLAAEVLCDWIKHSFMTKFNFIKSSAYFDYSLILAGDITGVGHEGVNLDHTHAVVKRLGLALVPLVCVWLRYMKEGVRYALMSYESSLSPQSEDLTSWAFKLAELYTTRRWGGLATAVLTIFLIVLAFRLVLGYLLHKVARRLLEGPASAPSDREQHPDSHKSYHTSSGGPVNSNKEKTS